MMEHECSGECAVDLDGMVELAHPRCLRHHRNIHCPLHGGEWAIWQCPDEHSDEDRLLYADIVRALRQAYEVGLQGALQMALYGSAFIQIDRVPGARAKVTVLNSPDVHIQRQTKKEGGV